MATRQTRSNKKYEASNAAQGIVGVRVFVPETRRDQLLAMAKDWRDEAKRLLAEFKK